MEVSIGAGEAASEPIATPETNRESVRPLPPCGSSMKSGRRTLRYSQTGTAAASPQSPAAAASSIVVNSLGMKFAAIPAGSFTMGSPADEPDRSGMENQHVVEITRPFCLGVYPVTQDEYQRVIGTNPSCFAEAETGDALGTVAGRLPVERVSWDDACEFCRRLSELPAEKAAGRHYRLPTEAEWEDACRAGTATAFAFGPSLAPTQANFDCGRAAGIASGTTAVGSFPPNAWGLHDMHGNVWEWCADWFSPDYYGRSASRDPQGPPSGFAHVLRGGGWRSRAAQCRSAARYSATATQRHDAFGFRVACITP